MTNLPTTELIEYLKRLRDDATAACDEAFGVEPRIKGAINWGDLFCVEACFVLDDDGFSGYQVTIEEADPYNPDLQKWVEAYLRERGHDVVVVTEW